MSDRQRSVDFLGIGVQKGGTTWIFHQLSRHPQIVFPRGKEVHFWDKEESSLVEGWIEALQPHARVLPDGRAIKSGEITPAYAVLPGETIAAIRRRCPAVRLFICLRNPMERAWSAAMMALARAQMFEHEASDQWFIDHFRSNASRTRGAYCECLARWWAEFPREQLLVLVHDDIVESPLSVLTALARHLDVSVDDFASLSQTELRRCVVPRLEVGAEYKSEQGFATRSSLVPILCDMYGDEVERVGRVLGRDLSHWVQRFRNQSCNPKGERIEVAAESMAWVANQRKTGRP